MGKILDLSNLCRTCMSNRSKINASTNFKQHINEKPTGCWNEGLTIKDLLQNVQPKIEIYARDKLPKILCNDCVEQLQMTYEFLRMYKDTDHKFRKMLKEDDSSEDEVPLARLEPVQEFVVNKVEINGSDARESDNHPEFEEMYMDDLNLSDVGFGNDTDNDDGASMESSLLQKITSEASSSLNKIMSDFDSPPKKVRRVHSDNKDSCCNCDVIEENVDDIKATMRQIQGQLKLVMSALAEQKTMLKKVLRQQTSVDIPLQRKFPLTDATQLEEINEEINEDNRNEYIKAMRPLMMPLQKNLQNILSNELIAAHNIDGVHGKGSLKSFSNFYSVLLDSIPLDEEGGPVEERLRMAVRLQKKRYFKRISVARSKNS